MKFIINLLAVASLSFPGYRGDIYSQFLHDIDGNPVNLSSLKGKKILFVVLPLSQQDTCITAPDLASLEASFDSTLTVIGVPAEESGYSAANKDQVKMLYSSQRSNFILTEGMKVSKGAGGEQAPLFRWLTDKDQNKHFDLDVQGTGQKFFVDERGVLYAVMGSKTPLNSQVITRILSKGHS